jgi:hypothetical protein
MIFRILIPALSLLLLACTSVKVIVKKPNFEKVEREKAFVVFPLQSMTARENETFFENIVKPSAVDKIIVHYEPSMEWELKRLGIALEDTSTFHKMEQAGYGYLLFFQLTNIQNAELWEHYREIELGNKYDTSVPYTEPQADMKLTIYLRLYSVKSRQFIYENIARANRSSTNIEDNKGGVHVVNTGSLSTLHRKAIKKALNRMYDDCDL